MCYDEELSVPFGQLLIERGADITEQTPVDFSTPLHVASLTHNCGLATLLLANGADVHGVTTCGDKHTPLHFAVQDACSDDRQDSSIICCGPLLALDWLRLD
jgi:ankyrin repeat protein